MKKSMARGVLAELLLEVDGVAGDVVATLGEEEPKEEGASEADGENGVFDGEGPFGSVE